MILFVSNMQNGGLNAAESEYLKQLANTLGGMDILEKQVVFVMSNLHQVEDDSVQKIITEHKKMIQLALGFEPKKICVYDAMTYQEGVKQNEQVLIDLSGIPALKAEIERHCQSLSSISEELYQQRITEKKKKLIADVNAFLEQYRADLLKLKARAASGSIDMNQLNAAKTKIKKIVQEFLQKSLTRKPIFAFIWFRWINNSESLKYYESKSGNYYYDTLITANKILVECNNEILKTNVKLPVDVIQEITIRPKAINLSGSEMTRIERIIRDFLERVTKELNDRIDTMLATADKIAEESNQNNETNRRADMLEEAIEAVQRNLK